MSLLSSLVDWRGWVEAVSGVALLGLFGYAVLSVVYPSVLGLPSCELVFCRIGGHSVSYAVVFGVGLIVGVRTRKFSVGVLFALFSAFLLEDMFAVFWILHGGSVYILSSAWLIGLVLIVWSKPFRLHLSLRRFSFAFLVVLCYFVVWFAFGFPTTYGDFGATLWVANPFVNLAEIGAYVSMGVAVLSAVRHVEMGTAV